MTFRSASRSRGPFGRNLGQIKALDGVSFQLADGEILGLVGESGCGKSTLGKTLMGIQAPNEGSILFDGTEIAGRTPSEARALRRRLQYAYQDPGASLDPRWKIGKSLEEPLIIHTKLPRSERLAKVREILTSVGLLGSTTPTCFRTRFPADSSAGSASHAFSCSTRKW